MANYSLRLMLILMFAAVVLNLSSYLFVRVFNAARHSTYTAVRYDWDHSTRKPKNYWADPKFWTAEQNNENKTSSSKSRRNKDSGPDSTHSALTNMMFKNPDTYADEEIENCPELPPGVGPEVEDRSLIMTNFHYSIKAKLDEVKMGGIYQPTNCKSLQRVAIIIAYRGCKSNLNTFMNTLHPFLIKQQLDYQIFVVEQTNKTQAFNRGKLLNVGFTEATRYREDGFHCIIFHEPHIVPMDSRNLYRCSWYPRQLAVFVERPVKRPYLPLLGGAIAFTPEQFLKFNGFSNVYWGNDADYYDLYNRINASNYYVENSFPLVGKYKTIRKGLGLWTKSEILPTPSPLYLLDGLTSLSYTVDSLERRPFFTYLQVNIDPVVETKNRAKMYDKLLNPVTYQTTTGYQTTPVKYQTTPITYQTTTVTYPTTSVTR